MIQDNLIDNLINLIISELSYKTNDYKKSDIEPKAYKHLKLEIQKLEKLRNCLVDYKNFNNQPTIMLKEQPKKNIASKVQIYENGKAYV